MIAVVGAGTMGAGIAQVAATSGERVRVYDVEPGAAARAVEDVADRLRRLVAKGRVDERAAAEAAHRVRVADGLADLADADLVVEAVAEQLGVKRLVFADLERVCGPDTILATNTSTISVTDIAVELENPGRVCGMHFFNPAPLMRLVEVPVGEATSDDVADAVVARASAWGKTAVRCTSTPGFIVNRVARQFYGGAQRIVEEGTSTAPAVDAAMRAAGFRMGPFELADLIGNDVNLASTVSVHEQTGYDPRYAPTDSQRALVERGDLGRKTGRGWYTYDLPSDSSAVADREPPEESQANPEVELRILAMLVNEAAALVDRGEATAADVDIAMRLGTNYPRGPLEWGDALGVQTVVPELQRLDAAHPDGRYRVADGLLRAQRDGGGLRG